MGSGIWSPGTYQDRVAVRGGKDAFAYSRSAIESGRLHPHQTLDPKGLGIRQSRDSDEHPESNSIIISLDVTGSMGAVVRGIHADLPQLFELLLGHKYIAHPQIMFAAVGDAFSDYVPLQVGQFESDNRMDQNLENMVLEGGGGGQNKESYELMFYVAARHTAIDCWEKRKRKGYLFMIGDELAYSEVRADHVNDIIGNELQQNVSLEQIIAETMERYHIFYLIPGGASHGGDARISKFWAKHLGEERVLHLQSPDETSEIIGLTIGVNEGAVSLEQGVGQLRKKGMIGKTIDHIATALGNLIAGTPAAVDPSRPRRL